MLWLTVTRSPQSLPRVRGVEIQDDWIYLDLLDGRRLRLPTAWSPSLLAAAPSTRAQWRLLRGGEAVHWTRVGELLVLHYSDGARSLHGQTGAVSPGSRGSAPGPSADRPTGPQMHITLAGVAVQRVREAYSG